MKYHLAQYNIARLVAPLDDPRIEPFMAALDPLNRLAEESPGFVWRLQTDEGNSTSVRVYDDPLIIVNFSVWESTDALSDYAYKSGHAAMYSRRREFFELHEKPYLVCWWIPAGHEPTVEEADERLRHLEDHGPTPRAFTLKQRFPAPDGASAIQSPS